MKIFDLYRILSFLMFTYLRNHKHRSLGKCLAASWTHFASNGCLHTHTHTSNMRLSLKNRL